jgi:hypothetical protein
MQKCLLIHTNIICNKPILLGSVIALIITNLLPLAMTLYEDLGYLCVKEIDDEEYSKSFKNNSKKQYY